MNTCWSVLSCHGSTLAARADGTIVNMLPVHMGWHDHRVHLYRPRPDSSIGLLFSQSLPSDVPLGLNPQPRIGGILPVRVTEADGAGRVSIYSPENGLFLTFAPPAGPDGGGIAFGAAKVQDWEVFTVRPEPFVSFAKCYPYVASLLADALTAEDLSAGLGEAIAKIEDPRVGRNFLNVMGMFLSDRQYDVLARMVIDDNGKRARALQRIYEDDIAAQYAIPEVLAFLTGVEDDKAKHLHATPGAHKIIGPEYDPLDGEELFSRYRTFPARLNVHLRERVVPRHRACVIACARNEGLYLLEWVAHHLAVGFDRIFVYSNDNTDGSDALLDALHRHGAITWVQSRMGEGVRAQAKAYAHALRVSADTLDYEWTLPIDLDEFFLPHLRFGTVGAFLDWHETRPVDAIGINWRMVGSNGQARWRDDLMFHRFPRGRVAIDQHMKTLFRTRKFIHSYPHDPIAPWGVPFEFRNASGEQHRYDASVSKGISLNPSDDAAEILHFFFKSNEELLWKSARNRGDDPRVEALTLQGLREWIINAFNHEDSHAAKDLNLGEYAQRLDAERDRLLSQPDIRAAWDTVMAIFNQQIGPLIERAKIHPVMTCMGDEGRQFMAPFGDADVGPPQPLP